MGKALWDPHPTETDLRARQLAAALGYPLEWRVVRTIEKMNVRSSTTIAQGDTSSSTGPSQNPKTTEPTEGANENKDESDILLEIHRW